MLRNAGGNGAETGCQVDSYRDRVGALVRDDHLLAYVQVAVEGPAGPAARRWRRSVAVVGPSVTVHVRFLDDETLHSQTLTSTGLESHLRRWAQQQHVVYGDVYQLRWLDGEDADRTRERFFVAPASGSPSP